MRNIVIIFSIVLTSCALTHVKAQETTQTPESNEINSKLIRDADYRMKWYAIKDTVKIEIGEVYTSLSKKANRLSITSTVKMKNTPDWIDETVAEIPSWKPVKHSSSNLQRDMLLNFEKPSVVTGYYNDKSENKKTEINEKISGPFFDSNLYPQLICWLPLKSGYKTELSIFDYNPKSAIGLMKAYILDTQKGTLDHKSVWVVKATDDLSKKQTISTYYIEVSTRQVLRQDIDMGSRKMMMERF